MTFVVPVNQLTSSESGDQAAKGDGKIDEICPEFIDFVNLLELRRNASRYGNKTCDSKAVAKEK